MAVTFYIPAPLRQHTRDLSKVELDVSVSTVAQALAALWQAYPGLRDRILTEQGEVRQAREHFRGRGKHSLLRRFQRAREERMCHYACARGQRRDVTQESKSFAKMQQRWQISPADSDPT